MNRRQMLAAGAASLGLVGARRLEALPLQDVPLPDSTRATPPDSLAAPDTSLRAGEPPRRDAPRPQGTLATRWDGDRPARIHTPNGSSLTGRQSDDGAWVYHLTASEVAHAFAPGLAARCWGYNGQVHGPTIEGVEGDEVRIYVTNRLPVPTAVHWNGLHVPNGMDGAGGLTQPLIQPGETFLYGFPLRRHGTCLYHAHHDPATQVSLGLTGMIVVHPPPPPDPLPRRWALEVPEVDRDVALLLHEWHLAPGTSRPDPDASDGSNLFTMNGRAFPGTAPIVAGQGDRVRLRVGNLSPLGDHALHLHGHTWTVVATEGGRIPEAGRWAGSTVHVPAGTTRTVEFVAEALGDWVLRSAVPRHLANQRGRGTPNTAGVDAARLDRQVQPLIPEYTTAAGDRGTGALSAPENTLSRVGGVGPFGPTAMGGMATTLKVRPRPVDPDADPGGWRHPAGTVAHRVDAARAARDGVRLSDR